MSESATAADEAEIPDVAGETGTLTLDVHDDAPLDSAEVALDMLWDSPEELIVEAIERVDALGDETRDAALDIYLGEDGIGLGRWATADTREFHRGTSAPHDGLPGVGEAYGEKLAEARDEVLPEHPLVEWIRERPQVAAAMTRPRAVNIPDYIDHQTKDFHGVRYVGDTEDHDFEAIIRNVFGLKDTRGRSSRSASKWAYEYLHYDCINAKIVPTDAYWFTGGESEEGEA